MANKVGRPEKPIDWKVFEDLCQIHCTQSEIASFFNISHETLINRAEKNYDDKFLSIYKRFSDGGKMSLRRTQLRIAERGNPAMAIFLGKQLLGQRDHYEAPQQQVMFKTIDYSNAITQQELSHMRQKLKHYEEKYGQEDQKDRKGIEARGKGAEDPGENG